MEIKVFHIFEIKGRVSIPLQLGLIAMVALSGGLFILRGPSATWAAAAAIGGILLALGLAIRNMRRMLLAALAFLLPFYLHKGLFVQEGRTGEILSLNVAAIDVLLLLLAFLWLAEMAVDKRCKVRACARITVPAAIWFSMSALSIPKAVDLTLGLLQLTMMLKLLVLYLVVANQVRNASDTKAIVIALLGGLFLQSVLGLYQRWTGQPLGLWFLGETPQIRNFKLDLGLTPRPQGTIGHPNDYAMYLEMLLPLALAMLFAGIKPRYKLLIGLTFCMGAVALLFSLSRGGWLGFGLGIVVMLFLLTHRGVIRLRGGISPLIWVILLLMIGLAFSGLVSSRLRSSDRGAFKSRFTLMQGAIAMIEDHPLLGVGLNNYTLAGLRYYPEQVQEWGPGAAEVHNIFLLIAAEVGLVGAAAFLWSLVAFFKHGLEFVRRASMGLPWLIGSAILVGSSAALLHNQADYALMANPQVASLFWFMVGWLVAISGNAGDRTQPGESK